MKVLISAFACGPEQGSEPCVGWNLANQIASLNKLVYVITRVKYKEQIMEVQKEKIICKNLHFVYYDLPLWRIFQKNQLLFYLYLHLWQFGAYLLARKLHSALKFDIVHHVTFCNDWVPSFMCFLPIPFVYGPIGGSGLKMPKNFLRAFELKWKIQEKLRDIFQYIGFFLNPISIISRRKAKAIIACNTHSYRRLSKYSKSRCWLISQVGIRAEEIPQVISSSSKYFNIVTGGILIYWKGFRLALNTFIEFYKKCPNSILTIIGSGPERDSLRKIVSDAGLNEVAKTDCFLYPSLREGGGFVVIEALSLGVPVICLDIGGPSDIVTDECGIKVRPTTPSQTILDLSKALEKLVIDKNLREKMAENARRRALEDYNWNKKGQLIQEIYEEITGPNYKSVI